MAIYSYHLLRWGHYEVMGVGALLDRQEWLMIDWKRVNELRDEVGIEDFREVVQMFLEEVEGVMVRLISVPDITTFEEDMHFLKGSALNLGFARFFELCEAGEKAAKNGLVDAIYLDNILESYAASKSVFKERFGCMKAA